MDSAVSFDDIKELFRETGRRMQETDRQMQETDRRLRELGRQIGGLGNRLGDFVEGVGKPGLVRIFAERGIKVENTLGDLDAARDGIAMQVDLFVVNDGNAVAVEVKSKLRTEHVDEHIRRLDRFKKLFPEFAHKCLMGALAAMVIPKESAEYAMKCGLFVIGQSGDNAVILNGRDFAPVMW